MSIRISTIEDMMEALVDLIDGIDAKMQVTPPGTDYYLDLERQKEEFERQLADLAIDEAIENEDTKLELDEDDREL